MRRTLIGAAALAATLLLPLAAQTPLAQGTASALPAAASRARVIVKYRADSALLKKQAMTAAGKRLLQAQALGDRIGVALTAGRGITERSHVVFAEGMGSKELAAKLSTQSDVEYAVPDERKHIVAAPNDSFYASGPPLGATTGGPAVGQWYLKPPAAAGTAANTAPAAINAEQAWDVVGTSGSSVVVAVIDTGVRFDHVDLQGGNVLQGYDMISADCAQSATCDEPFATAGDGDGRDANASDPGDFVTSAQSADANNPLQGCTAGPSSWHGTQTLGLIGAATNNGVGIASVGQGIVKVMPVRALGRCGGFDSDIAAGMYWAAGLTAPGSALPANPNPAKVISMSLGGTGACSQVYVDAMTALRAAGVTVVAAAGNESAGASDTPGNCPGVISVAALRSLGDKVGFSNVGPEVAIAAPGGNCGNNDGTGGTSPCQYPIMTTGNSGATTPVLAANGGSIYTDALAEPSLGTSFSTPLVAGTVALMLAVQPSLTPAEIRAKLQATARAFPTSGSTLPTGTGGLCTTSNSQQCYCTTSTCGAGMLDAHAAVLAALGVQARITVTTPTPTAGQEVALTSSSLVNGGQTIASYAWTLTSAGTTGAAIVGAANAATVDVTPTAAGTFAIQLATTDAFGVVSTASTTVTVAAAATTTPPSGSSSSGGGALGAGWLLLLLGAVLALAAEARLAQRRGGALSARDRSASRRR